MVSVKFGGATCRTSNTGQILLNANGSIMTVLVNMPSQLQLQPHVNPELCFGEVFTLSGIKEDKADVSVQGLQDGRHDREVHYGN